MELTEQEAAAYEAAKARLRQAWKRLDEFWQTGEQGTDAGYDALREMNDALAEYGKTMPENRPASGP